MLNILEMGEVWIGVENLMFDVVLGLKILKEFVDEVVKIISEVIE